MKTLVAFAVILMVLGPWPTVLAQGKPEATAVKAVEIAKARKANAALMRQYSWHSRIELIMEGTVKDTRIEVVNYDPTGQLQRTLLNDHSANLPIGFLRRAIVENERQQVETYLKGLTGLLEQYTLPTAGKVLDFMTQAQVTGPDSSGVVEMTGHSVVVPGDTFSLWSHARTLQTRKVKVASTFQDDVVDLTATFKTLPSRLTYVAYAEVTVPAKQMVLKVQNFDFNRSGDSKTVTAKPPAPPPSHKAPIAAAPAPPATASKPLPLGRVVTTLPAGCAPTPVGGVEYYYCGGNFYRAVFQGNTLVYVTAKPE